MFKAILKYSIVFVNIHDMLQKIKRLAEARQEKNRIDKESDKKNKIIQDRKEEKE